MFARKIILSLLLITNAYLVNAADAPAETKPAVIKPAVIKPAVTKPVITKSAAIKPPLAQPAAANPTTAVPAATTPATTKPVVAQPVAVAPAAVKPPVITVLDKMELPPLQQLPDLSLNLLQQNQPALRNDNVTEWMLWERKRLQLMNQLDLWQAIVTRCNETEILTQPIEVPLTDRFWLSTQRIQAWIELHAYDTALTALRQLLWQANATPDAILGWRQQLIHVYLGQDNVADAERAMRRYRQDYADQSNEPISWKILQAQLLLRVDRPQEAYALVRQINHSKAIALALLAQLQAQTLTPDAVRASAQKYLAKADLKDEQRVLYLYVSYRASVTDLNLAGQIAALEPLLINSARSALNDFMVSAKDQITADQLWRSYEQYGMQIANQQQLLQGDDKTWMALAEKSTADVACSLYATLVLQARQLKVKQQALTQLSAVLEQQADGMELMRNLFLRNTLLAVEVLPLAMRYKLIDYALSRGDLQSAAQLMEALQQPPKGQDAFDWNLRRARVLILSGQYQSGAAILTEQSKLPALTDDQVDQYLQVAFDLQTVVQHDLALAAFAALDAQRLSAKNRRELAYWKAESLQKLGRYTEAAMLYLESAPAADGSFDPWYQTAIFQAAEAMADGGLLNDARRQYLTLLNITVDPGRQAVIKQRLQDLRLLKSAEKQNKVIP